MDYFDSEPLPWDLFGVRASNVLRRLNIRTVGAFLSVNWQTVECWQLGQTTRNELQSIQADFNPVVPRHTPKLGFGDTWTLEKTSLVTKSPALLPRWQVPNELPTEWQNLSSGSLEVSVRARSVLDRGHIETLMDFLNVDFATMQMRQLGATTRAELRSLQDEWREKIRLAHAAPDPLKQLQKLRQYFINSDNTLQQSLAPPYFPLDSQLLWVEKPSGAQPTTDKPFFESPGEELSSVDRVLDLPQAWPLVVRELSYKNEREFAILARRFGLDGCASHTLEELSTAFVISRERVRQIEASVMKRLLCFVFAEKVHGYHKVPHPAFIDEIANFQNVIYSQRFPISEAVLERDWIKRYGAITDFCKPYLELLCELLELSRVRLNPQEVGRAVQPFWLRKIEERESVAYAVRQTRHVLEESPSPLDAIDFALAINKEQPKFSPNVVHPFFLERVLELCPDIEKTAQKYQLRFEYLPSHIKRVERVFREWATEGRLAASTLQVAQEVNARLPSGESVTEQVVSSSCGASPLIISIGGKGGWSLREHAGDTRLLHELIEEALRIFNRPASIQEIVNWILPRRETTMASVAGTMSQHNKFQHIGINQHVLRDWKMADDDAEPVRRKGAKYQEQFEDYLLQIFLENDVQPIALAQLVRRIAENFGWPEVSVRDRIKKSPHLDFEKLLNNHVLIHWRDSPKPLFAENLAEANSTEPQRTKRGRIQDAARRILQKSPDGTLDGPSLVQSIARETGYVSAMIYNALSSMPDVERGGTHRAAIYSLVSSQ